MPTSIYLFEALFLMEPEVVASAVFSGCHQWAVAQSWCGSAETKPHCLSFSSCCHFPFFSSVSINPDTSLLSLASYTAGPASLSLPACVDTLLPFSTRSPPRWSDELNLTNRSSSTVSHLYRHIPTHTGRLIKSLCRDRLC